MRTLWRVAALRVVLCSGLTLLLVVLDGGPLWAKVSDAIGGFQSPGPFDLDSAATRVTLAVAVLAPELAGLHPAGSKRRATERARAPVMPDRLIAFLRATQIASRWYTHPFKGM